MNNWIINVIRTFNRRIQSFETKKKILQFPTQKWGRNSKISNQCWFVFLLQNKSKQSRNPVSRWSIGSGSINEFAFSSDQTLLAIVSQDGFLRVFNYEKMELVAYMKSYFGGLLCVRNVRFSFRFHSILIYSGLLVSWWKIFSGRWWRWFHHVILSRSRRTYATCCLPWPWSHVVD